MKEDFLCPILSQQHLSKTTGHSFAKQEIQWWPERENKKKYTYRRQKCVKRQHIEKWCRRTQIFATHIYHNIMRGENSIATYMHLFCAYDNTLVRYSAISVTIHVYRGFIKLIRTPKVVFFNEKKRRFRNITRVKSIYSGRLYVES